MAQTCKFINAVDVMDNIRSKYDEMAAKEQKLKEKAAAMKAGN